MKIGTAEIMRNIDRAAIEEIGIPGIVLMENAALKVLKHLALDKYNSYVVICGVGNNGGDGFAIARHLKLRGKSIEVFVIGNSIHMTEDCKINYNILKKIDVKPLKINNMDDVTSLRESLEKADVVIDAIFGTGLKREITELYSSVISVINENSKQVVAVDVPSGMDSNTGKVLGQGIRAKKTISFQLYKRGFLAYGTDKYTGDIVVEDIGIPEKVIKHFHNNEFILERDNIAKDLPLREKYGYKGDYGRVLVVAGSEGFTGAAYITTEAAVRSGAGLVTLGCVKKIRDILSSKLVEAMTMDIEEESKFQDFILKSNVICVGPGLGNSPNTLKTVKKILLNANGPVVIDADGINVLEGNLELLKESKVKVILTPHLGEMAKITSLSIEYIRENRIEVAKDFAAKYGVIVLLKGYNTVITDGEITYINPTGNSAMASGGMGDCLTGIIAGFISQGQEPLRALCSAAFLHGYLGEELSKDMYAVNASHIIERIPYGIKKLQEKSKI